MQKLKSEVFEKLQIKIKIQKVKALPSNPAFQIFVASLLMTRLLSELKIRPLGLIFLIIFFIWFFESSCNLRLQIPAEFENYLEALQKRVIEYRQSRPSMFCVIACGYLAALAVVAHFISGSVMVLIGLILAGTISTKHSIKIIKIEPGVNFGYSGKLQKDYDFPDEFLPEESEFNMFFLEKANDFSSHIEDAEDDGSKSDEVPSELLIPDAIPEVNESSTDDDQDDLLPIVPVPKLKSQIENSYPSVDALVKYSHSNGTIEFKKGHFKRDSSLPTSSSSSEESLSKGLNFPDHTAVDGLKALHLVDVTSSKQEASGLAGMVGASHVQTFIANNSKLIPTLMTGLVQEVLGVGSSAPIQDLSSKLSQSDESDFEMLEQEDFQ